MNTLKILIAAAVILAIAGIFLPQEYKVSRELVMRAPVNVIQQHVADMERWVEWTAWDEVPPPVGPRPAQMESGVGSGLYLSGTAGTGWFLISDDSGIDGFEYLVLSGGNEKSKGNVTFTDLGGEVRVNWTVAGRVNRPPVLAPYIAMSKEFLVGSSLSQNLKNLKKQVEYEDR